MYICSQKWSTSITKQYHAFILISVVFVLFVLCCYCYFLKDSTGLRYAQNDGEVTALEWTRNGLAITHNSNRQVSL